MITKRRILPWPSRHILRAFAPVFALVLAACTAPITPPKSKSDPTSGTSALFEIRPDKLFEAFQAYCTGPALSYRQTSADLAECREYLSPQPTASIILRYDGTVEDLPQLVLIYSGRETPQGYIVTNYAHLNVPRTSGPALKVVFDDPRIDRHVTGLLRMAGGKPIKK